MLKRWGLAVVATLWTTAALTVAMALDAVRDHVRNGSSLGTLAAQHLMHVVVLTVAVYIVLWISFDLVLAAPLRSIAADLYRLGTGSLEPLSVRTRVSEIHGVERAVNLMIERMKLNFPRHSVDAVQANVIALRAIAQSLPSSAESQAKRIMDVAMDLQLELATLVHGDANVTQAARAAQRQPGRIET